MKIVFTAEHSGDLTAFQQLGELLVEGWALGKPKLSAGQLIELAHDADVLVTSYDDVTQEVIAACPRLQVIACTRANPVNIDTKAAQARGIRVLYTPGAQCGRRGGADHRADAEPGAAYSAVPCGAETR
ncbi:D-3-phosphoglycerate dehydrogenase [Raoultella planticola]|uniref:D-3-phosphoglycerate dehydrogenase n=1 Tax=Raoultella planticola TaxID=575 RepID=A0A485AQK6_RAOPL|nr:D-3-phosphoglycerate dehydrogenase [Raoultella planticola]